MNCTPKDWNTALERLRLEIPEFAYASWIAPLSTKLSTDRVVLGCPSSFHRDHVRIVYAESLERLLREVLKENASTITDTETNTEINTEARTSFPRVEVLGMPQFADAPGTMFEFRSARGAEAQADTAAEAERQVQRGSGGLKRAPGLPSSGPAASESNTPSGPILSSEARSGDASPETQSAANSLVRSASDSQFADPQSADPESAAPETVGRPLRSAGFPEPERRGSARVKSGEASAPRRAVQAAAGRREIPQGPSGSQPELPFSFDNFVVGPCNALAREAALALARRQQQSLNMLYLGGESGMGKTHLARATAEAARPTQRFAAAAAAAGSRDPARHLQHPPSLRSGHPGISPKPGNYGVVYTSAEEFTTEFVSAMRNGRADSFRRRYRGATGLLVVEDIQFFSGRVKTQLELFHTVQHVLDAGGSVMMTGDRSPRELTGLDDRIRTQVARGFIAELEPPDALVRRHILRSKAAAGGVRLPSDCLNLLVDASHGSVRDIEGILIQVVTTASLLGRDIDMGLTREAIDLKTSVSSSLTKKTVAVTEIVRIVAGFFGKKPEALAAKSRRRDVLVPRQLAMYLAHRYTDASLAEIGRSLGRGHPSVRNAIERVDRQVLENAPIRYKLEALCERIDRTLAAGDEG